MCLILFPNNLCCNFFILSFWLHPQFYIGMFRWICAYLGCWSAVWSIFLVSWSKLDEGVGSSEEDLSVGEMETLEDCPVNEDRELKEKLWQKYSGYISTLKHEFSKKKEKGKLPKEARQLLLDWWNVHYKWPYPTVNYMSWLNNYLEFFSEKCYPYCLKKMTAEKI